LIVKQTVPGEIFLNFIQRNRQFLVLMEVPPIVCGVGLKIWGRKSRERVCHVHLAIHDGVGGKHAPHQNAAAPAPNTGFDEIPRNSLIQRPLRQVTDILKPTDPDHRVSDRRPIVPLGSKPRLEGSSAMRMDGRIFIDGVGQDLNEKIKV